MNKISRQFINIFFRYLILIIIAFPNFWIFYFVFTPLTVYPVYFLLNIFFDASLMENIILIKGFPIELIPACIAGAAYYLLLILNLSTPKIKLKQRIQMILFSFPFLLILNILRIFFLSLVFLSGNSFFDFAHRLFWYLGSTAFVVGIWFIEVKIFKIKEIPIYSDIKFLYRKSFLRK
ncbi:MAG: pacearchaeosortase [Candidatus Pacearchaeota archaeon]|jgi:exosortase/archaeosortase family protein